MKSHKKKKVNWIFTNDFRSMCRSPKLRFMRSNSFQDIHVSGYYVQVKSLIECNISYYQKKKKEKKSCLQYFWFSGRLLTENHKVEIHDKALKYLQQNTRRCSACGEGHFAKLLGIRYDDDKREKKSHNDTIDYLKNLADFPVERYANNFGKKFFILKRTIFSFFFFYLVKIFNSFFKRSIRYIFRSRRECWNRYRRNSASLLPGGF